MELRPIAGSTEARPAAGVERAASASPPAPAAAHAPTPAKPAETPPPDPEQLAQAVKNINRALQVQSQDLEFSVDHDSARMVVTVTDKTTHEVIRQMPSKEAMEIARALDHLQSLLIRHTV